MSTAATDIADAVSILAGDLADNRAGLQVLEYDQHNAVAPYLLVAVNGASARPTEFEIPVSAVVDGAELGTAQRDIARLAGLVEASLKDLGYGPAEYEIGVVDGLWVASWRVPVPRAW